jgi:hypothetical protein
MVSANVIIMLAYSGTLNPKTSVLVREERKQRNGDVKTEVEAGVTHLQAKEYQHCWQPPEARRRCEGESVSEPPERTCSADALSQTSSLWKCERINSCCLKPPSLLYLVVAATGS